MHAVSSASGPDMSLRGVERRLERLVEGAFGRVFRSGLRPVELGRKLHREMDEQRTVSVGGRTTVPNHFVVHLSADDLDEFSGVAGQLTGDLGALARDHARDEGYHFMGPVAVVLEHDPRLVRGTFRVEALFRAGAGGARSAALVSGNGNRTPLGQGVVRLGREPECQVVLADPNVSRVHAEVRPHGEGFTLVDLQSTNGTKVNGVRIVEYDLVDGDELMVGNTPFRFEAF